MDENWEILCDAFDSSVESSSKYHTGIACIEENCDKPAGSYWSPYWCFDCNSDRMKRISTSLKNMVSDFE